MLVCAHACIAEPATVSLHEQVLVAQGTVTLGQLADISAEEELAGQLAAVEIGRSPLAGHQRSISAGYVRMRMARAGFHAKTAILTGAGEVLVRRDAPVARSRTAPGTHLSATAAHHTAASGPPLLRRGTKVQIVLTNGGIVITTTGQLLEDAAIGQSVMARVRATGQKIYGTLTGPRRLTVRL